jgi:hypothetical protein
MATTREVLERKQLQGVDEAISYRVLCTPLAVSVGSVKVYDETNSSTDVTTTVMPAGTASVSGGSIVLPLLRSLTAGHLYRIEVQYSDGTNTFEPYIRVEAER